MNRIVNAATYIGMLIVIGMAILTGLDVGGRYLFKSPIKGAFELTEVLLSSIVAFGIAATTAAEEHITVDAFSVKLKPSVQRILKLIANFIGLLVFAVLVWQGILSGRDSINAREQTEVLGVPISPFRLVLVFGFFLSLMVLIYKTISLFRSKTD
jgi:TRAP-type C4-dicarboxylate transport system permease small subunit